MSIVSCLASRAKWLLAFHICNYIDRCKSGSNNCGGMDKNRKRINSSGIYKGHYKSRQVCSNEDPSQHIFVSIKDQIWETHVYSNRIPRLSGETSSLVVSSLLYRTWPIPVIIIIINFIVIAIIIVILPLLTYILSLIPFIVVVSRRWPSSTSAPLALPFSTIAIAIFITNIVILIIAIIFFYRSFCSSRISWKVKTILYCEVVSYELGYSYLVD